MVDHTNRPCAAPGLTSYRYPTHRGDWIMIGAIDEQDALREANRSLTYPTAAIQHLQVWNGTAYVPVFTHAPCKLTD